MHLIFSERFGKRTDKESEEYICSPMLMLNNINDDLFKTNKYICSNNLGENKKDAGIVDISHYFFNLLDNYALKKLNALFEFSKLMTRSDYIDKKVWNAFLITSGIELPAKKQRIETHDFSIRDEITKNKFNIRDSKRIKEFYNSPYSRTQYNLFEDKKEKIFAIQKRLYNKIYLEVLKDYFSKSNKIKYKKKYYNVIFPYFIAPTKSKYKSTPLFHINSNQTEKKKVFVDIKNFTPLISINHEITVNNQTELLFGVLDCLFSSEYNYCLKKCELEDCQEYFITTNLNSKYCDRGSLKYQTCKDISTAHRKKAYEDDDLVHIERKINNLMYNYRNRTRIDLKERKELENRKNKYLKDKKMKKINYRENEISKEELYTWFNNLYKNTKKENN